MQNDAFSAALDIQSFWHAVIAQDADAMRRFLHPDAIVRWHCTNEQFTAGEYIRANCEYPGEWVGELERCVQTDDQIILAGRVQNTDNTLACHVVSFIRHEGGKVLSLDEYWGDDAPAPDWRQQLNIGRKIV